MTAEKRGGRREGSGRPKGSKNVHHKADARTATVWGKVSDHTLANLHQAAELAGKTPSTLVAELVHRKYRCRCAECEEARRV